MNRHFVTCFVAAIGLSAEALFAAESPKPPVPAKPVSADVFSSPKASALRVTEVQLEFRYRQTDRYLINPPAHAPERLGLVPLSNGLRLPLEKVAEIAFRGRVEEEKQGCCSTLFEHRVYVTAQTTTGQALEARLEKPIGAADVFLVGKTDLGAFELQLDPSESRDVRVVVVR